MENLKVNILKRIELKKQFDKGYAKNFNISIKKWFKKNENDFEKIDYLKKDHIKAITDKKTKITDYVWHFKNKNGKYEMKFWLIFNQDKKNKNYKEWCWKIKIKALVFLWEGEKKEIKKEANKIVKYFVKNQNKEQEIFK